MLTREQASELIKKNVSKNNVIYHMIAVEAIMRRLALYFAENEDEWGLVGLLHDVDYEKTETTPEKHGEIAALILKDTVPESIIKAIKAHNSQHLNVTPETRMEKALIACDAVSGLLIACALVMPTKKLEDVKAETVLKKFRDKDFARGASRDRILICEQIGIPKEKFLEIALEGLKKQASKIEL